MKKNIIILLAMFSCWTTMLAQQDSAKIIGQKKIEIGGETITLKLEFAPVDTFVTVIWESSHPDIATIDQGTVTGVAAGKTIITAIADGLPAPPPFEIEVSEPETPTESGGTDTEKKVTQGETTGDKDDNIAANSVPKKSSVSQKNETTKEPIAVDSIAFDEKELTLGCAPDTLTYTIKPKNATDNKVAWKSLSKKVTIDGKGVVTPLPQTSGRDTIVITSNNNKKTDTCFVTVIDVKGSARMIQDLNDENLRLKRYIDEKDGIINDLEGKSPCSISQIVISGVSIATAIVFFILVLIYSRKFKREKRKKEKPDDELVNIQQELAKTQGELKEAIKNKDHWKAQYELEKKHNNKQAGGITINENRHQNPPKYGNVITKEEVRPKPSNRLFADFIDTANNEFRNIAEVPSAMTNFVLVLSASGTTATFKVYEEAISRVMDRSNYLAGCIKDITPNGTNFSQTEGKAHKQGDKWIVDDNNRLKVIIS